MLNYEESKVKNRGGISNMSDEVKNELIIDFTEYEKAIYNNSDIVEEINVKGEVSVINPSTTRVWNVKLSLKGIDITNLEDDLFKINEIKSGNKWVQSYEVNPDIIKAPVLFITETVDTYYELPAENWAGVLGKRMPTAFRLTVENTSEATMKNIKIVKKLHEYFAEPIFDQSNVVGKLSYDSSNHEILWEIDSLGPKAKVETEIRSAFTPETKEPYGAGEIKATYEVLDIIRTKLDGMVEGHTDNLFAVDISESMESPGLWECTAEFENSSGLNTTLRSVKVIHLKPNLQEVVIEEAPQTIVKTGTSWSKDFTVKSDGVPKFKNEYDFTVNYVVHRKIIGEIVRKENIIPVADIQIEKIVEPPEIPAYATNTLDVKLIVKNTGSAALNEIHIEDVIPPDFKPPEKGTVDFFLDMKEMKEGITLKIEPDNDDPSVEHKLIVDVTDLNKLIEGFKPESQFSVNYQLTAINPKPKVEHKCPLTVSANVKPAGPPVKPDTIDLEIGVKYVQRKIRALKQVQPLETEGEYRIPIIFQNKGEIVLENVEIKDLIPTNFTLVSWEPEDLKPEIIDQEDGSTRLIWRFDKVEANERINLAYIIKGSGEYTPPELEYTVS